MKLLIPVFATMMLGLRVGFAAGEAPPASTAPPAVSSKPAAPDEQSDVLNFRDDTASSTTRLGGGARGKESETNVFLLVSAKPGRTISSRPTIYWYLTADTESDVDLVISRPGDASPTYRIRHTGKIAKGLQAFSLAEASQELKIGVQYKVTVTVWENADDPSVNPFSAGFIERVAPPPELGDSGKEYTPSEYSAAGLWYDALDSLARRIEKDPANSHLRNQRLSLLRQQQIFLTFAPEKRYAAITGVVEAQAAAKAREQKLLAGLAATDKRESDTPSK
jgi:hypothetical protein